jgi:hypothetical protein
MDGNFQVHWDIACSPEGKAIQFGAIRGRVPLHFKEYMSWLVDTDAITGHTSAMLESGYRVRSLSSSINIFLMKLESLRGVGLSLARWLGS